MVVPAAVDDRQQAVLVEPLEADHRGMEAEAVGDLDHVAIRDPQLRSGAVVRRIPYGTTVFRPSLPPDSSITTRIRSGCFSTLVPSSACAASAADVRLKTSGSPAPTPMPYNPRTRKSRREHEQDGVFYHVIPQIFFQPPVPALQSYPT